MTTLKLIKIRIEPDFNFEPYLHQLAKSSRTKVLSYQLQKDRLLSFTSEYLKNYYLAAHLKLSTRIEQFNYGNFGRPSILANQEQQFKLDFNLSHSGEYVVMAIYTGLHERVGVDIEKLDPEIQVAELSPLVFSVRERQLVKNSAESFIKMWTKKESLIKAYGSGFANELFQTTNLSLDDLDVDRDYIIFTQKIDNYYLSCCILTVEPR